VTGLARHASLAAAELQERLPAASLPKVLGGSLVADNWQLMFAALSLLLCAVPLLSINNMSVSLFGASAILGQTQTELHQLNTFFGGGIGGNPWGAAIKTVSPQLAETPRIYGYLLTLGYLVYAVPLSALAVGVTILRQKPAQGLFVTIHAASCFAPLAILLFAGAVLPNSIETMFGQQHMMSPVSMAGFGVWALAVVGALQFASLRGVIGGTPLKALAARAR
jgi:hypothetical protein